MPILIISDRKQPHYPIRVLDQELALRFRCTLCNEIMVKPTQSECGCRFCLECIEQFLGSDEVKCPSCQDQVIERTKIIKDKAVEKEIMNVEVRCLFDKCPRTMRLNLLESHMKEECEFRELKCDKCDQYYPMSKREGHQDECMKSMISCDDCGNEMTREEFIKEHKNPETLREEGVCDRWRSTCPYKCQEGEEGEGGGEVDVRTHLEVCRERPRPCVLEDLGCEERGSQEMMRIHMEREYGRHQLLMMKEMSRMKTENEEMRTTNERKETSMRTEVQELSRTNQEYRDKIEELRNKVRTLESQVERYKTHGLKGGGGGGGGEGPKDIVLGPDQATWTVSDIRTKIKEAQVGARKNELVSDTFYITRPGYHLSMKLYLNGDGRATNKFLSAFFVINQGDYDSWIRWPFQSKITLTLVSNKTRSQDINVRMKPDRNQDCYGRPSGSCNVGAGQPEFVPVSDILNMDHYLHDGAIKLRVTLKEDI